MPISESETTQQLVGEATPSLNCTWCSIPTLLYMDVRTFNRCRQKILICPTLAITIASVFS